MTQEEKARELSHKWIGYYRNSDVETACLEMAAWKEQQMIEVLGNLLFNKEEKIYRAYLDYDAFFEDLRKAMEDNL